VLDDVEDATRGGDPHAFERKRGRGERNDGDADDGERNCAATAG
jgi:hypothetical protein